MPFRVAAVAICNFHRRASRPKVGRTARPKRAPKDAVDHGDDKNRFVAEHIQGPTLLGLLKAKGVGLDPGGPGRRSVFVGPANNLRRRFAGAASGTIICPSFVPFVSNGSKSPKLPIAKTRGWRGGANCASWRVWRRIAIGAAGKKSLRIFRRRNSLKIIALRGEFPSLSNFSVCSFPISPPHSREGLAA